MTKRCVICNQLAKYHLSESASQRDSATQKSTSETGKDTQQPQQLQQQQQQPQQLQQSQQLQQQQNEKEQPQQLQQSQQLQQNENEQSEESTKEKDNISTNLKTEGERNYLQITNENLNNPNNNNPNNSNPNNNNLNNNNSNLNESETAEIDEMTNSKLDVTPQQAQTKQEVDVNVTSVGVPIIKSDQGIFFTSPSTSFAFHFKENKNKKRSCGNFNGYRSSRILFP